MAFDAPARGFLVPLDAPPTYGTDLDDVIGDTVAGITGLDRDTAVRPRWVPDPAAQPAVTVNWCAVGHTDIRADDNASTVHDPLGDGGDGADQASRGEEISVLASFYGPNASGYARRLLDGFAVQQNRAAMLDLGLAFGRPGAFRNVSGLVATENLIRCDFDFTLRRRVLRTYAVPSIRSASGLLISRQGSPAGPVTGVDPFRVG